MKFLLFLSLLTGALAIPADHDLSKRQLLGGGSTANDFVRGGCKGVIMIYARASTEPGNIGMSCGPVLQSGLNSQYRGDFAMQGVDYPADLPSNFLPKGTQQSAIDKMAELITQAATRCPNAKIAAGGYSQGTAVAAGGIAQLPSNIRDRVGAVVLFGYTQNQQNRGGVPGYPSDRLKVYCASGDLVCRGTLTITLSHFTYSDDARQAVNFIVQRLGR